jgi:DNA-binding NarL/FixJ family response regulator
MDRLVPVGALTRKEQKMAEAYAGGKAYHQIAQRLSVAPFSADREG